MSERKGNLDFLREVLSLLVRNKELPKYQFERAIDGFLATFLPGILAATAGGDFELVAQEMPLKKQANYQSTNADYVLFHRAHSHDDGRWVFVELKTDPRSVREEQAAIYARVCTKPMDLLLADVEKIRGVSRQRLKYSALLQRFDGCPTGRPIELIVYLSLLHHTPDELLPPITPPEERAAFEQRFRCITFDDLRKITVPAFAAEWDLFREIVLPVLAPPTS